jgi:hypothetical protein
MITRALLASCLLAVGLTACVGETAVPTGIDAGADVVDAANDADAGGPDGSTCGVASSACCSGNVCNGGSTCQAGVCACLAPKSGCGGSCVDLASDPKNCGTCGHDCLGGTCSAGKCDPVTLVTGQASVTRIAPTPTRLYWSRSKTNTQASGIFASDVDGQNAVPFYGTIGYCGALVASSTHVYFTCDAQLLRCPRASCGTGPTSLAAQTSVADLAFDAANDRLYFAVSTPYNTKTGGFVGSIPAAGGAVARLVAADQPSPSSIVLAGGTAYWINAGTYLSDVPQLDGGLRRAPLGTNQTFTNVASDPTGADLTGLAVDTNTAYWAGSFAPPAVHSVALVGGSPSTFTKTTVSNARQVLVDAKYVYWIESANVYRCEKSCTKPTTIAAAATPIAFAQDDVSLYWSTLNGEIRRVAK